MTARNEIEAVTEEATEALEKVLVITRVFDAPRALVSPSEK